MKATRPGGMTEAVQQLSVTQSSPAKAARRSWQRRAVVLLCALGWTLFVVLALDRLLRPDAGPSVYIVHDGGSGPRANFEKFRAWSKADLGIQRVYPWVLLGPYVAWIALCFPLERGRLRLSLPLNLAACAGFVAASHAISERTSIRGETVVFVRAGVAAPDGDRTNSLQVAVNRSGTVAASTFGEGSGMVGDPPGLLRRLQYRNVEKIRDVSEAGLSNLLVQLQPGAKSMHARLPPPGLPRLGLLSMLLDLLAYCAVGGLAHSVHFSRRFREREHQALVLESNLAQARLDTLRAQLQPHFLFNSLNAIATLLRRDPRLAEATLLSLSDLLRLALSQSDRQEVALAEEINLVRRYLEIQQTRFGEKLRVEQEIDPAALDCLVPTLLLQPVVENAIRHGIEPADRAGLVRLSAQQVGGRLVLTVADNGVGLPSRGLDAGKASVSPDNSSGVVGPGSELVATRGNGIGLANLRARLETLYGTRHYFELATSKEGGVSVRIEIPWRPVSAAPTAAALTTA